MDYKDLHTVSELNKLLLKISVLRIEIEKIKSNRRLVIKANIISLFNQNKTNIVTQNKISTKAINQLVNIENELIGFKSDIERYRRLNQNAKSHNRDFEILKNCFLKENNKGISNYR